MKKGIFSKKKKNGITLIALVVTIVILLILSGVTINMLLGEDGIIGTAQEAKNTWEEAVANEQQEIQNLVNELNSIMNDDKDTGGGGDTPEGPTIPEGLEIGSTVSYNPSGTYNWQSEYATSYDSSSEDYNTYNVTLNSATGESFNLSSWKVLSIDENTGTVELVPSSPTTETVHLQGAQGYNNSVKLLNDACNALYGNITKGISARSINIEDIEKYMTFEALADAHSYSDAAATYGNQVSNEYLSSNSRYPVIYAQEKLAVINGTPNGNTSLDLSEQNTLIERSQGTSTTSSIGAITTATSIQPYQTYWYKDETFMSTAFQDYKTGSNYYNLIIPKGTSTTYWVASRNVGADSNICGFHVCSVYSGSVSAYGLYFSYVDTDNDSRALFPVVILSSELIEGNATSGFSVSN